MDKDFSDFPDRRRYEEGRTLMERATKKIADQYHLSVLCMASRPDQPDHSMHIQHMSATMMAAFLSSLLTEKHNGDFMKSAIAKVPDRIWLKTLGIRFALFYMAMGAGVWAGFEVLLGLLRRVTVN